MSIEHMLGSPCPAWCAEHREQIVEDTGVRLASHLHFLTDLRNDAADDHSHAWVMLEQTTISGSGSMDGTFTATLSFNTRFEGTCRTLDPDEARAVAEALLAGADAIEAMQTEACVDCGRGMQPRETEDDEQRCGRCSRARWKASRAHLTAVPAQHDVSR